MTLIPALLFSLIELLFWGADYGHSAKFFLDGASVEGSGTLIDNRNFGRWVFPRGLDQTPFPVPFVLATKKPAHTVRVFVVGESAAMGFPDPSSSFPRILEVMLKARDPSAKIEVVNASLVAINSHVVVPIAKECLRYDPDMIVVHLGNNEVVGPFGASGVLGDFSPSVGVVRTKLAVNSLRSGQFLDRLFHSFDSGTAETKSWQGMAMFIKHQISADSDRLPVVYDNFRRNLEDICLAGIHAGVPVVVCTVPSNLRDSAPFGSLHAADLSDGQLAAWNSFYTTGVEREKERAWQDAITSYRQAAAIDDHFAELEYRLGRCYSASGNRGQARQRFARARDLDTLRFRTDSKMNGIIRDVVDRQPREWVYLADAEAAFERESETGIAGEDLFLEHVHMNFSGNYLLAKTVCQSMFDFAAGPTRRGTAQVKLLSEAECRACLAYSDWTELKIRSQIYEMLTKQPPFINQLDLVERSERWKDKLSRLRESVQDEPVEVAKARFDRAIVAAEDDWMLHLNYGQFLSEVNQLALAERQYHAATKHLRHAYPAYCKRGLIMLRMGSPDAACEQFETALRLAPDFSEAHYGLAEALAAQGKTQRAIGIFSKQASKESNRSWALASLGAFLARNGQVEQAEAKLREALEIDPKNPMAHAHLGDLSLQSGRSAEAIEHYQTAIEIRPDWPELATLLANLRSGKMPSPGR